MGTAQATRASEARAALWARYDEGAIGADELDARLRAVDRAGSDDDLERALTGPVRATRRGRGRALTAVAAVAALALLVAGTVAVLGDDDGPETTNGPRGGGGFEPIPLPQPEPGPGFVDDLDCPELDGALDAVEELDDDDPPANPAPLSDPPALPEGYTLADEVTLVPGSDPSLPMSIAAGTPLPTEIHARALLGPLNVTMRAFTYESAEVAAESGLSVIDDAICAYGGTPFAYPDHPGVTGSTVSGVIPTTAFANWRVGERRFTVSVEAAIDGDPASTEEAEALAGEIAALELEAARTAPPDAP